MKTRAREGGFTLVEIAIVLVIIGLLLGGILKGQELITSARVRNLADQGAAVQAAYYGFVDRYRAIPGDMSAANACAAIGTAVLTGCNTNPGGDANGRIDSGDFGEAAAVWAHLSAAGFLQGTYLGTANDVGDYTNPAAPTRAPTNPWNGSLLLARTNGYLVPGGTGPLRLHLIIGREIPVNVMRELDVKIDDSAPGSGVLRAPAATGTAFDSVGDDDGTCVTTTTPPTWNITPASVDCNGYYLF
ncbi:MAG: prepilin-type N-terminal cleavage/methylation domain-containing protein [Pseudomonadota bacterium]|nr:prepilin-type N-terminal cleavage/methylation domain-containing protein [Gammaproteobacteria bacterium]MDQ3583674.1 prepilin-type N-terminal cleavage/methylation domain-containing protein [Pseudomonadota bacterium]